MDIKHFKFEDPSNPRIATNIKRPPTVYLAAAGIFALSLYGYQRKYFRIDKNTLNFALFAMGSAFASYQWSAFFLSTPEIEAGIVNNKMELKLQH